jgi:hypothetical protein
MGNYQILKFARKFANKKKNPLFPLQEGNLVSWNILTNETSVIVSHDLLASVSEGKINTFEDSNNNNDNSDSHAHNHTLLHNNSN